MTASHQVIIWYYLTNLFSISLKSPFSKLVELLIVLLSNSVFALLFAFIYSSWTCSVYITQSLPIQPLAYFSLSVDSGPNFLLVFIINIDWKVELTEWQLLDILPSTWHTF